MRWKRGLLAAFGALLATILAAQNAVTNAEFDESELVAGWDLNFGSWLVWSPDDSDGCAASGAAWGASAPYVQGEVRNLLRLNASGCLNVAVGENIFASMTHQSVATTVRGLLYAYSGPDCSGALLGAVVVPLTPSPAWWRDEFVVTNVPEIGAASVGLGLEASTNVAEHDFSFYLDRVFLVGDSWVFADDFEGGGATPFCRWSAASP